MTIFGGILPPRAPTSAIVAPTAATGLSSGPSGAAVLPPPSSVTNTAVRVAGTGSPSATGAPSMSGRVGVSPPVARNATAQSVKITDTLSDGNIKTYLLQSAGDCVAATFSLTVTATTNSDTVDILNALSRIVIYAPGIGPIITLSNGVLVSGGGTTMPDIYMLSQRFSQYGQLPATVNVTGATAVSASFYLAGLSLPAAKGPYTLEIDINTASGFSATATALTVVFSFEQKIGVCPAGARLRYTASPVSTQPVANGSFDYGPNATQTDIPLTELFISGMATTADISALQLVVAGNVVTQNSSGADLGAIANSQLVTAMPTGVLYTTLAVNSAITLGRASTFLVFFGASVGTAWRFGYCWHD